MLAKYFSIVGYSKSGKTFLIEKIISYLTKKGYKVGVCKYIHHPGFGIDIPDKDTTKYYENGAKIISYVAPDASGIIYIEKDNINMTLRNIETKVDYLILEGFRDLVGVPNIALIKDKSDFDDFLNEYTTGVTSHLIDLSKHNLFIKNEDIPIFVEKRALPPMPGLNCKNCGYKTCHDFYIELIQGKENISKCDNQDMNVKLLINNKQIILKPYVEEVFQRVVTALVETLKKPDEKINSIDLLIRNL